MLSSRTEPQPGEDSRRLGIGTTDPSQLDVASIDQRQDDVAALDAGERVEDPAGCQGREPMPPVGRNVLKARA